MGTPPPFSTSQLYCIFTNNYSVEFLCESQWLVSLQASLIFIFSTKKLFKSLGACLPPLSAYISLNSAFFLSLSHGILLNTLFISYSNEMLCYVICVWVSAPLSAYFSLFSTFFLPLSHPFFLKLSLYHTVMKCM